MYKSTIRDTFQKNLLKRLTTFNYEKYPGFFITIEGGEAGGKTTQINYIADFFKQHGYETIVTKEPGYGAIGAGIRNILLNPQNEMLTSKSELLLFGADRAQHIETLILPSVRDGKIVLSDRFKDSTRAYQGYGRGIDRKIIEATLKLATNNLEPDLTLLFDLDVKTGQDRIARRKQEDETANQESRFDDERIEFHNKIRSGFLNLSEQYRNRFRIINAESSIQEVSMQIQPHLEQIIYLLNKRFM